MIQPSTSSPVVTSSRFATDVDTAHAPTLMERVWSSPRRVSWGAIVAGAVAALAIQIIFMMLGTAIGLTVIGASDDAPGRGLSIAGAIYWLVTGLISLYIGGTIAGHLRDTVDGGVAAMHGFLTWCAVTVLSMVLLAMAGGAAIAGSLGAVGDVMANNNRIQGAVDRSVVGRSSADVPARDLPPTSDARSPDDTTPRVSEEDAKRAARNVAGASWWTLLGLVLGATVATVGGRTGARKWFDRDTASRPVVPTSHRRDSDATP